MSFPFERVRHLLIDLDGVLYRGEAVLPHAAAFISWLHERGLQVRLVTNNSTLTPGQYVTKLAGMGIQVHSDEVFTSALATALFLQRQKAAGQTALVIGEGGLLEALRAMGMRISSDCPAWVIVGLDRELTYDKLARAALAIAAGARFIGTNPDRSLPTEVGLTPGAGAIQVALTATTGVEPLVIGKPRPLMLELAMQQMGAGVDDTAMLGDRLDTDIAAAHALRLPSIMVLTGVSTRADLQHSDIQPSLVVPNLSDLMNQWRELVRQS